MRIVIDGTPLLLPSAGVKTYTYYWIRALREQAGGHSIGVFPWLGATEPLEHERSLLPRRATLARLLFTNFSNIRRNPVLELFECRADVFHASPHLQNPPRRTTRLTATIHDMTCWRCPELHVPANVRATKNYAERVLRRARATIAISEHTRADALEILRLPEQQVEVIYPGVAPGFFEAGAAAAEGAAARYGLAKPYLLYVGTIEPRKNVDGLLDAYGRLTHSVRDAFDLVLAGSFGWCMEETRRRLLAPPPGVRSLGYVPEADLPGLTAGAAFFVFPSFYEGFGLPVAQAMACGRAAVVSRGSSLEEIAGEAALLVDPRRSDEIAAAMERLAGSPTLCAELGARGRQRAQRFRWERCAEESLLFFRRAVEG